MPSGLSACRQVALPSKTLHTRATFVGSTARCRAASIVVYRGSQMEDSNRLRSQHARPICFEWLAALSVDL